MEKLFSLGIVSTMNQDQIEKYIEKLFDSLKPMEEKNKDIIKQIKTDIKLQIKNDKHEIINLKKEKKTILNKLKNEKNKNIITNESTFLSHEQVKQLKMKNKELQKK